MTDWQGQKAKKKRNDWEFLLHDDLVLHFKFNHIQECNSQKNKDLEERTGVCKEDWLYWQQSQRQMATKTLASVSTALQISAAERASVNPRPWPGPDLPLLMQEAHMFELHNVQNQGVFHLCQIALTGLPVSAVRGGGVRRRV